MTTVLYRKRPGEKVPNGGEVVGAGTLRTNRKERFADVCEGCGRFWQCSAMGFQLIFAVYSSAVQQG